MNPQRLAVVGIKRHVRPEVPFQEGVSANFKRFTFAG